VKISGEADGDALALALTQASRSNRSESGSSVLGSVVVSETNSHASHQPTGTSPQARGPGARGNPRDVRVRFALLGLLPARRHRRGTFANRTRGLPVLANSHSLFASTVDAFLFFLLLFICIPSASSADKLFNSIPANPMLAPHSSPPLNSSISLTHP
jgi:hypothetical protein